jgi:hypothetical protein
MSDFYWKIYPDVCGSFIGPGFRDRIVGIATLYGLESLGIEFCFPDRL